MSKYLAQSLEISGFAKIEGPLKSPFTSLPITTLGDVINIIVFMVYPLAGIVLLLFIILGGYDLLLSGGDKQKVESGQKRITAAITGFFLLIISYLVVRLIVLIFGIGEEVF